LPAGARETEACHKPITGDEMAEYRRPFLEPGEGRRPMLTWPRQLPIGGEPAEIVKIVDTYAAWLSASAIAKLYIRAEPGTHSEKMIAQVRRWPNQQEVSVRGIHYPQEDAPDEIGVAIATWLEGSRTPRQ
jgi:haloalkane dehalogenase